MSTFKMTFSLASLVLIFAFAFVATSAVAETGGLKPAITLYDGPADAAADAEDHVQTREAYWLEVRFDNPVTVLDAADDFEVNKADSINDAFTPITGSLLVNSFDADEVGKVFILQINLADTSYEAGYVSVVLLEDAATGNSGANNKLTRRGEFTNSSLPKNNDWTFTPALDATNAPKIEDKKLPVNDEFAVKFTLSGGTVGFPSSSDIDDQIQVKDADGMDITSFFNSINAASLVGTSTIVTFTVGSAAVDTPVHIGINPNWAAGTTLQVPAAATETSAVEEIAPTVDISLIGTPDETASTFQVRFTFEEATNLGANEEAADVPIDLVASNIAITKEDPADPTMMVESDAYVQDSDIIMLSAGKWVATIHYEFDALPLYVTLDNSVNVSAINGMVPAMDAETPALMVGMGTTDPGGDGMNTAPVVEITTQGTCDSSSGWIVCCYV